MSNIPDYELISTELDLKRILSSCRGPTALDFETTSLLPKEGKVRLVSLCNDKIKALVDFDKFGRFKKFAHLFTGHWVVFNAGFETRWFMDAGCHKLKTPPIFMDVGNLRRAIIGGGVFRLAQLVDWDLNIDMSKEQQLSNWSANNLSQEQLDYAYFDAEVTWQLWKHWEAEADDRHFEGFNTLNNMVPAVIEMEDSGMLLDPTAHSELVKQWERARDEKEKIVRHLVPTSQVVNINSDSQWSDYFAANCPDNFLEGWPRTEKTGRLSMTTETLHALSSKVIGSPLETFLDGLADYKTLTKYINSFGQTLINSASLTRDNRIHARFNIGYAKTGRFSSSSPNLQQIPRDRELMGIKTSVRKSFIAGIGRLLVSLDYSGIELRVLALLANDEQLLEDVIYGDVHAEVASKMAGRTIDKSNPEDKALRSKAKGVSFGIIYGSGASGLAATMKASNEQAQEYIDFWATRYKKAFNYRYDMLDEARKTRFIRVVDGGTIYMGKNPDLPKCANYPVQRAALSVMARAIWLHKASLDALREKKGHRLTRMLATIHDALIDECATNAGPQVLETMREDMRLAYMQVFPSSPTDNLVEGGVGKNWSELG